MRDLIHYFNLRISHISFIRFFRLRSIHQLFKYRLPICSKSVCQSVQKCLPICSKVYKYMKTGLYRFVRRWVRLAVIAWTLPKFFRLSEAMCNPGVTLCWERNGLPALMESSDAMTNSFLFFSTIRFVIMFLLTSKSAAITDLIDAYSVY
ncbi:hypothetical protein CEXT_568811 [Caerostris extrusa]|uniref:Uncharacterized protein n=1 Tax=Caerostris extrusa TaxID=172846 RepID=A0AAV4Y892_CAEEX|nr:hypothetical protein CEXT_568811 [Caerostris extrusa]